MNFTTILEIINSCFNQKNIKEKDTRCRINPKNFICALICSIGNKDTRYASLACLKRSIGSLTNVVLSRSSFWERMNTKKLTGQLLAVINTVFRKCQVFSTVSKEILEGLKVKNIYLFDSTTINLPDSLKDFYPSTHPDRAALKIHGLWNIMTQCFQSVKITSSNVHDSQAFPSLNSFKKGSLIIFDLAYWDYDFFYNLIKKGFFFLSRIKSNSKIEIDLMISNLEPCLNGKSFSDLKGFKGEVIEFIGKIITSSKKTLKVRCIGFWNKEKNCYHWYLTNLKVSAKLIWPVYKLRWMIETLWKSLKSEFRLDEVPSANERIITNLILATFCTQVISCFLSDQALKELDKNTQLAKTIQRASVYFKNIASDLFKYIIHLTKSLKNNLSSKMKEFSKELFDPNKRKRKTNFANIYEKLYAS